MRSLSTLIVSLILIGGCTCNCDAQLLPRRQSLGFDPNRKVDGHDDHAGHTMYNMGRVPEMPTGPNKLHCWIVVSDAWERNAFEYELAKLIKSDPRMQQIKAGTYFNYYTVSNPKFSQSGLVGAVGTATPIFVVTNGDGMIRADGSGGLFVNAKSAPQTPAEAVDMLCDAIEQMNPPPVVEGQTTATQIVRESSAAPCPDCTPNLPLQNPPPNSGGSLTPIKPRKSVHTPELVLGIFAFAVLVAGGIAIGIYTPGKKT